MITKLSMKNSSLIIHGLAFLIVSIYLLFSFALIKDYGITLDAPHNFGIGEKYLNFYLTGYLNFRDDTPKIKDHPYFDDEIIRSRPYVPWPFVNILSAVTCYLFYQKLHILDPISAHCIIIPILTALLLYALFRFVRKYWNDTIALVSIAALITYPRFFGDSLSNIKDVPEAVFFSVTMILFVEWVLSRKLRYLYGGCVCLGLALATKVDAIFVPVILVLWQLPSLRQIAKAGLPAIRRTAAHMLMGLAITCAVILVLYPPLFPGQHGKLDFLIGMFRHITTTGISKSISWNLYAPVHILYTTPEIFLVLFIVGLFRALGTFRGSRLDLLLIIWVLFLPLRHCIPFTEHYDGLRHFLIFIIPFSVIAAIGADYLSGLCSRFVGIKKGWAATVIGMALIIPNLYWAVSLHPFQTTYFNSLIGGLKGAQAKDFPYSCDYWMNSSRKAGEWLNTNATTGARYYAYPSPALLKYYIPRNDITIISKEEVLRNIPSNTYVVIVPRRWWLDMERVSIDNLLSVVRRMKTVYQIMRQGGEIVTIYYNP